MSSRLFFGFEGKDTRLIINMFKMNLKDKYLGSFLGIAWVVIQPLIVLGMYTFIFGFVFKARLPGADTTFSYAIWLLSGLVPYLAISESLTNGTNCVLTNSSLVKNVIFKTETLPFAASLIAFVPFLAGMGFLFILLLIDKNYPTWHLLLLIPVVSIHLILLAGLGLFLGSTAVFIRDLRQIIPTVTLIILFFTPILYPIEIMPRLIRRITFLNPFYQVVKPYRDILVYHSIPDWGGLLYLLFIAIALMILGLIYFRKLKGYFEMAL
jgi:lipopolysaccharide transport system permease protein